MKRKRHEKFDFIPVGLEIMRARLLAGLSQQELARRSGVSQADISRIESGYYNTSVDVLDRLATSMGKELLIKFTDEEEVLRNSFLEPRMYN
ncbi:MAG: helix-turn-helix transcriptional regulator [Clostridiales bacterium]|nr:helix-turn-helix transcriptional regulator [Clostridiales bacterium]